MEFAFQSLKTFLMNTPLLIRNVFRPFILEIDAFDLSIILSQLSEKGENTLWCKQKTMIV